MKVDLDHEYNQICRLIDKNQVISFDVYDTALLRNVLYPTDIFDLVQIEAGKKGVQSAAHFKQLRIEAERTARSRTRREDVRFHEIYDVISEKIGTRLANQLKELELQVESRFTTFNPFIKKVYDYAVSGNKTIYFISDMYLETSFLERLLQENGYAKHNGVHVSGEIGLSKATSSLYEYIRNFCNINASWLHIGDNRISDYQNALKCGLNAYCYKPPRDRAVLPGKYSLEYSIIKAIQINHVETSGQPDYWYRFGVCVVSALFFGFANWLATELRGKDNVYFLSRDGYLPWRLYRKFAAFMDGLPEPRYLYTSRKIYQLSAIADAAPDEAIRLLLHSNTNVGQQKKVMEIFHDIGIEWDRHIARLETYGFRSDSWLRTNEDINKMKKLLKEIYPEIRENQSSLKRALVNYLRQNDVLNHSEINVVDIGWRGSTQKAIKDIANVRMTGYYFGTSYNVYDEIRAEVKSYAFHLGRPVQLMQEIMDNVMMFEFAFSAPHGSLVDLKEVSGEVRPVLSKEAPDRTYAFEQIEQGVLRIADDYLRYREWLKNIQVDDALKDYLEFIRNKSYEDLLRFKDLSLSVGFGELSEPLRFVTSVSIRDYMKNRKKIEKEAAKNLWKNAIIVEGSAEEFKKKRKTRSWSNSGFVTKDRLMKALKNPRKAFLYLFKLISNK
jgi:HAD superfamily hydrolase (TIGR01549 family)